MKDCLFCKIVRNEMSCYKIAESEKYMAFLDVARFAEGHTLVIPKQHYDFVWDVENVGEFYEFAVGVANHFRKLGYNYVDSITFGRMIKHAHYHLIPNHVTGGDWEQAIQPIGSLQRDSARRLTKEEGLLLASKLSVPPL